MLGAVMKRIAIALFAVTGLGVGLSQIASAADLPVKAPVKEAAVVSYNWSGFYVGGHVGYSWNRITTSHALFEGADFGVPNLGFNPNGFGFGATAGYNYVNQNLLVGIEGDFTWLNASNINSELANTAFSSTAEARVKWLSTVRGRIGYIANRLMIFATGGVAIAEIEGILRDQYDFGIVETKASEVHVGWTVGGGLEFAATDKWTVKVEYLYYDLGTKNVAVYEGPGGWNPITYDVDATGQLVRIGANFHF